MSDSSKSFQVTLDPAFLQESMRLWRQATDMQLPLHDEFKLHFMQNRRPILANHAKTAKDWGMLLRALSPATVGEEGMLSALLAEVEAFGTWAQSELAKLDHMALQEALSASIDEALLNPDFRHLFGKGGPPAENS